MWKKTYEKKTLEEYFILYKLLDWIKKCHYLYFLKHRELSSSLLLKKQQINKRSPFR